MAKSSDSSDLPPTLPSQGCNIPHDVLNQKIKQIQLTLQEHHLLLYGNGYPGLKTQVYSMNSIINTITEDIKVRKQNTNVLYLTLLATVVGNISTALLTILLK